MLNKKKCKTCLEIKPLRETFYEDRKMKSGYYNECKSCVSTRRKRNSNHRKNQQKYAGNNPDKIKKKSKIYYDNNKEKENIRSKNWRKKNKEHIRRYNREIRRNNPYVRLTDNVRSAIRRGIKTKKAGKAFSLLPYSLEELIYHLESQFTEEMNWENYGPFWHIDHIIPMACHSPESEKDPNFLKAWSLCNLQPLKSIENITLLGTTDGALGETTNLPTENLIVSLLSVKISYNLFNTFTAHNKASFRKDLGVVPTWSSLPIISIE